jgi:hypothetical protein
MAMPTDRKRRAWTWIVGIVASMAGLSVYLVLHAHQRASEAFERHDLEVASNIAAIRARPQPVRTPLFGDPLPGNGWPVFRNALNAIRSIPDADAEQIPEVSGEAISPDAKLDEKLEALFTKHAPSLELLRSALRYSRMDPAYVYEDGLSVDFGGVELIRGSRFIVGAITHHHRMGRDSQAIDLLLQVLAMGQEASRQGALISGLLEIISEEVAIDGSKTILESHAFSAPDLERLVASLDALWKTRPDFLDVLAVEDAIARRTLVMMGKTGQDSAGFTLQGFWVGRNWRYLFSRRLAYAGTLSTLARYFKDMEDLRTIPAHARQAAALKIEQAVLNVPNPVVQMWRPGIAKALMRDAVAQMHWTLMRVATAMAWYEAEKGAPAPSLRDLVPRYLASIPVCPLSGKPLGYAPGKVWSFGVDGFDHGGVPNSAGDERSGGDVVWTVKRK